VLSILLSGLAIAAASPEVLESEAVESVEDSLLTLLPGQKGELTLIDSQTRALRQAERMMPGKTAAIRVGEKLTFSVRWKFIRAGEATLEIVDIEEVDGRPCYHVVSRAKSNGFFDRIYRVRDTVQSWMDIDFLYSRRFEKRLREGGYRRDQRIIMDHDTRRASYQNGKVFEFAPGAHDVLSAFYYVRTLNLEPGLEFWLESHADRKNYPLKVVVHGRERIKVPAGTFDCLVVEPMLRTPGLFKHKGKLTIWLTDDERRIPVQMQSKIPVGSISVVMTDYERPS
jgi:hypothetical protein